MGCTSAQPGQTAMMRIVRPPTRLVGNLPVPSDKSISHRALLLNALAEGEAQVSNFLAGADCLATLASLEALGVSIARTGDGQVRVRGVGLGGLREPDKVLDARNSGTTMRLLSGILAGQRFLSIITGDASLCSRPMGRVVQPLRLMGAGIWGRQGDTLAPLAIRGGNLRGIRYRLPVASAQLKSALLLAALFAQGPTTLEEPAASRDHTERMLAAMGADLRRDGALLTLFPPACPLRPLDVRVPGDISSAAFWLVAGAIHPQSSLLLSSVGINPTRTGLLEVLEAMGANLAVENRREEGGEPVADLRIQSSELRGVEIGGDLIPRLIDEIPAIAVAASVAEGVTVIRDASELRVKETDRIRAIAEELSRLGARIEERPDGLVIRGRARLAGAPCNSHGDHRLAMALAVAGLVAEGQTGVLGAEAVDVSYPAFWEHLESLRDGES